MTWVPDSSGLDGEPQHAIRSESRHIQATLAGIVRDPEDGGILRMEVPVPYPAGSRRWAIGTREATEELRKSEAQF